MINKYNDDYNDFRHRKKPKIAASWKDLNKEQKLFRIKVYSVVGAIYALGIVSCIFKLFIVGILLFILASAAIYVIRNIPYWYMLKFYRNAENEFQQHKDDKDNKKIYLTGNQMRHLFEDGVVDLGESMQPIILSEVFKNDGRDKSSK